MKLSWEYDEKGVVITETLTLAVDLAVRGDFFMTVYTARIDLKTRLHFPHLLLIAYEAI